VFTGAPHVPRRRTLSTTCGTARTCPRSQHPDLPLSARCALAKGLSAERMLRAATFGNAVLRRSMESAMSPGPCRGFYSLSESADGKAVVIAVHLGIQDRERS